MPLAVVGPDPVNASLAIGVRKLPRISSIAAIRSNSCAVRFYPQERTYAVH